MVRAVGIAARQVVAAAELAVQLTSVPSSELAGVSSEATKEYSAAASKGVRLARALVKEMGDVTELTVTPKSMRVVSQLKVPWLTLVRQRLTVVPSASRKKCSSAFSRTASLRGATRAGPVFVSLRHFMLLRRVSIRHAEKVRSSSKMARKPRPEGASKIELTLDSGWPTFGKRLGTPKILLSASTAKE